MSQEPTHFSLHVHASQTCCVGLTFATIAFTTLASRPEGARLARHRLRLGRLFFVHRQGTVSSRRDFSVETDCHSFRQVRVQGVIQSEVRIEARQDKAEHMVGPMPSHIDGLHVKSALQQNISPRS